MKILIVAATYFEVKPLLQNTHSTQIHPNLYRFHTEHLQIDVLITGIGMTFTTYHLTKHLVSNQYKFVINAGICGSFSHNIKIGDLVFIEEDQFADLGIESADNFTTLFDENLMSENEVPFSNGKLKNNYFEFRNRIFEFVKQNFESKYNFVERALNILKTATAITVNTTHGRTESIEYLRNKFNPEIESMEGAAFFYTCLQENVPFAQIRCVSNIVEPRNKKNWNISLAVNNLNSFICTILDI